MGSDDIERLKRELEDRLEDVIQHFNGGYEERAGVAYLSARNAKDLGSFQVNLKPKGRFGRGHWYRFSQGVGGDVLNLVAYLLTGNHRDYRVAIDAGRAFLGWTREEAPRPDPEIEGRRRTGNARKEAEERAEANVGEAQKMERARRLWEESRPLAGTHGEAYLIARGIPEQDWPPALRFHPDALYDRVHGRFPAIVAGRQTPDGAFAGIWRIYLDRQKPQKAPVTADRGAKIALGANRQDAVRLGPVGPKVAICEGIETGLGAAAIGFGCPVWAALSTSGLMNVRFPLEVDEVLILADGDYPRWNDRIGRLVPAPGRAAAEKAQAIHEGCGLKVRIKEPAPGQDWLDVWNRVRDLVGAEG